MAAANPYREVKLLRNKSMDCMAELRVVLMGNNMSQRCLVENLLVRSPEPQWRRVKYHKLTVINLPDLLQSDLTEDRLTELVTHVAAASSPGPHVFLLVLDPESFTEPYQRRLRSILTKFSEKSFDHVIVLLLTERQEDLKQMLEERPHLKRFIEECRYSYQWIRHCEDEQLNTFARAELFTRLTRIVKENNREYLKYREFKDLVHPSLYDNLGIKHTEDTTSQSLALKVKKHGVAEHLWKRSPEEFYFQIMLLGDGDKKKSKHKIISGKSSHPEQDIEDLKEWRGKKLKIVKSKDVFTMSVLEVLDDMKRCMREFNQGPNVLLLRPSAFTEKNIEIMCFILSLFGPDALKHSMLVFTDEQNKEPCENSLLRGCKERYDMKSTENIDQMMIKVKAMVEDNKGSFVSLTDVLTPKVKIEKNNFVFCGTHRSAKTRTISAILGPATCYVERSSECVKRQAEVSGRLVTIVELPALSAKPERVVLEECWNGVSMCEPEGVYAFVMVLPVASLTDEDKAEFQTIQKTFSSRIDSFTVILFTVESDPKAQVFTDFVKHHEDIQNLCRSCSGYVFININDPQRAPQVLEKIEKIRDLSHGFTTETFVKIQFARFTQTTSQESLLEHDKESEKTLRIVLIGKTGSGKSSSGNTILGRVAFKSDFGQKATTKFCQKERSIVKCCRVEVVDTPGLFDNSMSNQEIYEEMIKCISLLAPGPHVFLVVLGIGRFTPEENNTLNLIKTGFGKDAQKYIIVLFTHGEVLDKYKMSIQDYIKDKCDDLCQKLISDCGNRYHVFNNDDESKRQQQVNELIQKIDALVEENGGSCYTNKDLTDAEAAIQRKAETLLKEKEEEFKREKQAMENKHKQEMQEMQQRMEKEREETERVRQEKDNERRQMEDKIIHERELWKKEQEKRDKEEQERKEQDRVKRQEYEQKLKELGENLRQNFDFKSQEVRDKMEKERQVWEEKMKEYEKQYKEDKKRRQEEQEQQEKEFKTKFGSLRNEKKELLLRHEKEARERKELEEKHKQEIEDLRKSFEEEARKKAEELNEFRERKDTDFADMIDKHLEEVKRLKDELGEYKGLQNLAAHNETELKGDMVEIKTDMEQLQSLHKHQLIDLAIAALRKEKENCKKIKEIQKKHASEIEKCKKDITHEFEKERKSKTEALKTKQNQEMKDLVKNNNKDTLPQEMRVLSGEHKKQLEELQSDLWNQYKKQLKEELDEKKKQHDEEMSNITEEFLRKNEEYVAKQISDLEKKQKAEMDKFLKKAKGKVNEVELDQLKTKHQIEMDNIKKKMIGDKGRCRIL